MASEAKDCAIKPCRRASKMVRESPRMPKDLVMKPCHRVRELVTCSNNLAKHYAPLKKKLKEDMLEYRDTKKKRRQERLDSGNAHKEKERWGNSWHVITPKSELILGIEVPLKFDEKASWRKFKEFDKGNPILNFFRIDVNGIKEKRKMDLNHPLVPVLVQFSVKSFLKIFEQASICIRFDFLDIVEVSYISLSSRYVFYITLEAMEEGIGGVYAAKVIAYPHNGTKTLVMFVRTRCQPVGRKNEKLYADLFTLEPGRRMRAKPTFERRGILFCKGRNHVANQGLRGRCEQQGLDYINPIGGYQNFLF